MTTSSCSWCRNTILLALYILALSNLVTADDTATHLSPEDFIEADGLAKEASTAMAEGKLGLARQLMQQAVDIDPVNSDHRLGLARTLEAQGEDELAKLEYNKALELRPEDINLELALPLSVHQNETHHRLLRFRNIFKHHLFSHGDTSVPVSGPTSTLEVTATLRNALSGFLHSYNVKSVIDIGCGDMTWMSQVAMDGVDYTGTDIVPTLTENLGRIMKQVSTKKDMAFIYHDILRSPPPRHDVIFCRELFSHFTMQEILTALDHFGQSGSRYVVIDTYPGVSENTDTSLNEFRLPGAGRRLYNLELPPFSLSAPVVTYDVDLPDGAVIGVWQLPLYVKHDEL